MVADAGPDLSNQAAAVSLQVERCNMECLSPGLPAGELREQVSRAARAGRDRRYISLIVDSAELAEVRVEMALDCRLSQDEKTLLASRSNRNCVNERFNLAQHTVSNHEVVVRPRPNVESRSPYVLALYNRCCAKEISTDRYGRRMLQRGRHAHAATSRARQAVPSILTIMPLRWRPPRSRSAAGESGAGGHRVALRRAQSENAAQARQNDCQHDVGRPDGNVRYWLK